MVQLNDTHVLDRLTFLQPRPSPVGSPRPRIAKPDSRQEVEFSRLRTAIDQVNANEYVFRCCFSVFDEDIEIAVFVEDARIEQLKFCNVAPSIAILLYQPLVWELCLRVLVEKRHVRVSRSRVEIEVVLFDILSMIA